MNCTICGSDNGRVVGEGTKSEDTLCYICSCWFLVECQRRTGFGDTVIVVVDPEGTPLDTEEPGEFILGRKKDMEPVN